ncbi:MAG: prepilin-type N-terminal cleavage/methylation domain-containing protein [Sumerlaeia bacterium]
MKQKAFTLIELLIVVAIIAILAAIAVPNFLEAQVRAKVSRVKNDLRTIATGLESYRVDTNAYPTDRPVRPVPGDPTAAQLTLGFELTTPIAYLSSAGIMEDLFRLQRADIRAAAATLGGRERYGYLNIEGLPESAPGTTAAVMDTLTRRHGSWRLYSAGPDLYFFEDGTGTLTDYSEFPVINYDATNGTISFGDIFRDQKNTDQATQN